MSTPNSNPSPESIRVQPLAQTQAQPLAQAQPRVPGQGTPESILAARAQQAAQQAAAGVKPPSFVGTPKQAVPMPGVTINVHAANSDYYDGYAAEPAVRAEEPSAYVPYPVQQHQLDQEVVDYTPLSTTKGQACANCQWMLTPDGCMLTKGVIAPTGWCRLWKQETQAERPSVPVTITNMDEVRAAVSEGEEPESEASTPTHVRIQDFMASHQSVSSVAAPYAYIDKYGYGHFRIDTKEHVEESLEALARSPYGEVARKAVHTAARAHGVRVSNKEITGIAFIDNLYASMFGIKEEADANAAQFQLRWTTKEDGTEQLRWFGTWTNVFKDRSGTIIPTYSHKEYVDYVDREGAYPELLYWHVIGTEFGKADWMEYDGMLTHAAGYVYDDPHSRQFAIRLAEQPDQGMSHGTIYIEDPVSGDVKQHRTFELSVLPNENANNSGTVWFALKGDEGTRGDEAMAFSAKKKAALKELAGLDDNQVAALESQTDAFRQSLLDRNIEWKSDDEVSDDPTAVVSMATLSEAVMTLAKVTTEGFEQLRAGLSEASGKADQALVAANKSRDDIIADAIKPAHAANAQLARSGEPYVATKAADNVTGEAHGLTTEQAKSDSQWSKDFFGLVFGEAANEVEPASKQ